MCSHSPNDVPPPRTSAERIHNRGMGRRASVQAQVLENVFLFYSTITNTQDASYKEKAMQNTYCRFSLGKISYKRNSTVIFSRCWGFYRFPVGISTTKKT